MEKSERTGSSYTASQQSSEKIKMKMDMENENFVDDKRSKKRSLNQSPNQLPIRKIMKYSTEICPVKVSNNL